MPHRQNRCVIFDSELYHWTDRVNFRRGYEHRRINLTFLYGHPGDKTCAMRGGGSAGGGMMPGGEGTPSGDIASELAPSSLSPPFDLCLRRSFERTFEYAVSDERPRPRAEASSKSESSRDGRRARDGRHGSRCEASENARAAN